MYNLEEYLNSNLCGNTMYLLRKQGASPLIDEAYELYKIAYSMVKQYTNADDTTIHSDDNLLELSVLSPLTVNLYNNSFNGTTSESTSNDGISRSKSFSNADLLTPYKSQLAMYKRAKFI